MEDISRKILSLFDFTFTEFVTLRIIRMLYGLAIGGMFVLSFAVVVNSFSHGVFAGVGALVVAPLIFLLGVCFARVCVELVIVLFRIAEHSRSVADSLRSRR